jgi:hypothetical protein
MPSFLPYLLSFFRPLMVSLSFPASLSQPIPNPSKSNNKGYYWNLIVDPDFNQEVDLAKQFYIDASSGPGCENLFEQIEVVQLRLNKHPGPLGHEFIIVETWDTKDETKRLFVLDRQFKVDEGPPNRPEENNRKKNTDTMTHKLLEGLKLSPSRPVSPLSAMEEGTLISRTVSYPDHQLSVGDGLSLSAARMARTLSNSKDKGGTKMHGYDRLMGENSLLNTGYAFGQNGRQITPIDLTLFNLIILAQVVHDYAPEYTFLDRNCYWFCSMIFDACIELFKIENLNDESNVKFGPHDTTVSGRLMGVKVSHTDIGELSDVVREYRNAHSEAYAQVKLIFSKLPFVANSEQILNAHDMRGKAMLVDGVESLRVGQKLVLRKNCAKLIQQEEKYK